MALVHVRSKSNHDHETWVSEEWLERWPEDFEPIHPRGKRETAEPATDGVPGEGFRF